MDVPVERTAMVQEAIRIRRVIIIIIETRLLLRKTRLLPLLPIVQ